MFLATVSSKILRHCCGSLRGHHALLRQSYYKLEINPIQLHTQIRIWFVGRMAGQAGCLWFRAQPALHHRSNMTLGGSDALWVLLCFAQLCIAVKIIISGTEHMVVVHHTQVRSLFRKMAPVQLGLFCRFFVGYLIAFCFDPGGLSRLEWGNGTESGYLL